MSKIRGIESPKGWVFFSPYKRKRPVTGFYYFQKNDRENSHILTEVLFITGKSASPSFFVRQTHGWH
jgi:hypothetical protein